VGCTVHTPGIGSMPTRNKGAALQASRCSPFPREQKERTASWCDRIDWPTGRCIYICSF
jgi:hypothetical protein